MKFILPLILLIIGTGSGIGAGVLLKPPPPEATAEVGAAENCLPSEEPISAEAPEPAPKVDADGNPIIPEYAELSDQFVVPVIEDERIVAMIVMTIGIEVPTGSKQTVFEAEPRIRDKMLQVMFSYANVGGFSGNFTSSVNMRILRDDLLRTAREVLGDSAMDVLILDILRQDV